MVPKIISESVCNAPMNKNAHILIKEARMKRPELKSPENNSSSSSFKSNRGYGGLCWSGKNPSFDEIFSAGKKSRQMVAGKNPLFSRNRLETAVATGEEQLSKLHSVSQLSEKILENCCNSPLANVPNIRLTFSGDNDPEDDFNLVKPCVKLSRQVEHFGKLIHERNSQFVSRFRHLHGSLTSQNSFYFVDDDVLALEKNTFQTSDVDLPVVAARTADQMHIIRHPGDNYNPQPPYSHFTNPNVNVDCNTTTTSLSCSPSSSSTLTKKTITAKRSVSLDDHSKWNRFLKDISQLTIEIDTDNEEFL